MLVCTHPKEGADRELSPNSSVIELPMGYRRDPGSWKCGKIGKHGRPAFGEKDRDRQITKAYFGDDKAVPPKGSVYLYGEEVQKWHGRKAH